MSSDISDIKITRNSFLAFCIPIVIAFPIPEILLFIYLGLIFIDKAFKYNVNGDLSFSYLSIIGAINIPIIKFSVDWWNTLHQPASVIRASGPSINIEMLIPLMIMSTGVLLLFFYLIFTNIQSAIAEKKILFLSSKD